VGAAVTLRTAILGFGIALVTGAGAPALAGPVGPEPPHDHVDTRAPAQTGRIVAVAAGGDLQAVINEARGGDTIVLPAGATFNGPLTLPRLAGDGWVEIRSAGADELRPGRRVSPADASKMARIVGGDGAKAAVRTAPGAHHFRFVGIEFAVTPGAYNTGLVRFGIGDEASDAQLPHHLVLDRCWLRGDPASGGKRGLAMNGRFLAVIDSYFSDWKRQGQETHAISGWNGPGPFKIANNYLEASGVNLMFGGADPVIRDLVPSDIEIIGNHFSKPLAWRKEKWMVKNLFELKNARRVRVSGNLFEHTWAQAQAGAAILISPRNQDGKAPWSGVEDVTFIDNVVRGAGSAMKISGHDDSQPSRQTRRLLIRNNLFEDIDGQAWGGHGRLFTILTGTDHVVIEHNTGFPTTAVISADGPPHTNFVFRNNVVAHGQSGIKGVGLGPGLPTLRALFPDARIEGNVFIGGRAPYPSGNALVGGVKDVGFADPERRDWRLRPGSRFRGKAGGRDPGTDAETLATLMRTAAASER
jgi:hypothetical protein